MAGAQIFFFLIIAALVALLGRNRKIGYGWSLFFCIFLSPLIGLIIILLSKKNDVEFIDVKKEEVQK
jgi:energy-coupling factor transporter transmembrane protein EcfT